MQQPMIRRRISILRVLAAMLSLAFFLSGCGVGGTLPPDSSSSGMEVSSVGQTAENTEFILPYTSNDTLNPYSAQTKSNQEITTLLYDSLISLDASFQPVYIIADAITLNGTSCTIELKNVKFTDGSAVTAEDVTYSIKAAKAEGNGRYAQQLENISSQSAASSKTVSITLKHPDPYFINLLDFPIFKMGSENNKNADNKALPPLGSGRYTYHAEGRQYWLEANPAWQGGAIGIPRIGLKNLPDEEAVEYSVQTDGISAYYTNLSDNEFPKMNGATVSVPLFNLVYLGVNTLSGPLTEQPLRHAVSAAVDRVKFCSDVFYSSALPAKGPIPSSFTQVEGLQTIDTQKNTEWVVAQLNELGYNNRDNEGYLTKDGKRLSLKLLYNSDQPVRATAASLLATDLKAVGVEVILSGAPYDAYISAVQTGGFDLYLGEMKLQNNFNLLPLLSGSAVAADSVSMTAAQNFSTGGGSLSELLSAFNEEMPILPLCHRTGLLSFSSKLQGSPTPGYSDIYAGLEHCQLS